MVDGCKNYARHQMGIIKCQDGKYCPDDGKETNNT